MRSVPFLIFISLLFLISCSKAKNDSVQKIDVSKQWITDPFGNLILGLEDGQWQKKIFNPAEQDLFKSLDTADLSGTSKPDDVFERPAGYNCIFPNPFLTQTYLPLNFTNEFDGKMVFKYVIIDSLMNTLLKGAIRVQPNVCSACPTKPSSLVIAFMPGLSKGRFRFYFTLSSEIQPDFYTCWGNIQRN